MPSTSIRKTEYDPDRRTLSVWFVASRKRYEFEGVPPETLPRSGPRSPRAAISTTTSATISAIVWLRAIATRDDLTSPCHRRLVDALPLLRLGSLTVDPHLAKPPSHPRAWWKALDRSRRPGSAAGLFCGPGEAPGTRSFGAQQILPLVRYRKIGRIRSGAIVRSLVLWV
ncbi:KTSC domain-containing protein [Mesorhizobium sp. M0684]|uniref:KTSC domain-containing protein n=1 Tax=Mesorhizobium sp. M0684 TaxID=2956986 RepID=UPI003338132F